jgi:uncharacterized FlaG/YvyC family protein
MNTISNNKGVPPTGPAVQVRDQVAPLKPAVAQPETAREATRSDEVHGLKKSQTALDQPKAEHPYLDQDQMREFVAKVSEAIRKASVEPHVVGFAQDPDSKGYLVEIKKPDGTLIARFAPENVLNLNGELDDLSGMVIDRKT